MKILLSLFVFMVGYLAIEFYQHYSRIIPYNHDKPAIKV